MSKKGWEAALESGLKLSGENGPERELGWLMVAKYLPRCSEQEKRTLRSRVSSRFTNACQTSCSLKSSLFIRAALAAFPAFRTLYKAQLDGYLDELLREAQESSSDPLLERATRELWAAHATTERIERATAQLRAVVCEFSKTVEVTGLRAHRGSLLLRLVADCVRHADKGSSIPSSLLDTLGAAMEKGAWREEALRLLETVIRAANWAVASSAKSLCQSLIRMPPSASLYSVLTALEETLGASSHLHAHLAIVFNSLSHPLPAEYANEAAKLLETVFVRSGSLVDPAVLSCVCSAICSAALRYRSQPTTTLVYGRLVAALLSHGHDTVPVPVHIARALISSMPPCEERSRLQIMADAACRPRTHAMAPSLLIEETRRVRKEAAVSRAVKMGVEEEEKQVNGKEEEKMDQSLDENESATATAAHDKAMMQMRVMEGEETKEGKAESKEDEDEEEMDEEEEEQEEKPVGKKGIHIQSRKEKKKAAKKRRSEEKAAVSAAKKQKTAEKVQPKNKSSPSKEAKKGEEKKPLTIPKTTPLPPPQPLAADLQAVIDMAVLDFD